MDTRVKVGIPLTAVLSLWVAYATLGQDTSPAAWIVSAAGFVVPVIAYWARHLSRWPYICLLYGSYLVMLWLHALVREPEAATDLGAWSWHITMFSALVLGTWLDSMEPTKERSR
ncbi:hypothetical protein [Corynebacterium lowii]|uniref:Uncharacterized protein n=1 Tax=Corynebacterium lowii TaxID=1544413 RepID=A0A0Q1AJG1_9CORY|nr:hypothetical protein [Corynebacterium lowii]KQB86977.1 hypothetical protein Clow_00022 [Corynebacterium lowii]MDP9852443.1 hypothetical protein [Corynebacterium lowii]